MPDPRAVVALIIVLFIVLSPSDTQQAPATQFRRSHFDAILQQEEHSLNVLNTSRYGDFDPPNNRWLNISGFTNDTLYAWDAIDLVKARAKELIVHTLGEEDARKVDGATDSADVPLYTNLTGVIHGRWARSPVSTDLLSPRLNLSSYTTEGPFGRIPITGFERNLTGTGGSLKVRIGEADIEETLGRRTGTQGQEIRSTRSVSASIEVQSDDGDGSSWEMRALGVHFIETGTLLLTTTSSK